ncbi:MAG: SGNH/GDSL hydrolase family protein [Chlorobia bacterium]|nr:SGNH/GDSL hydrolase family protein [Fimbriimonadaceae bacterium]
MKRSCLILSAIATAAMSTAQLGLVLKNGDRVAFYGDSITDNGYYTKVVETFVRLRYPDLDVRFFNAGVGGDRVGGGWMGPVDERLTRDLFSRKPTVVTVMLGMNDGGYQQTKPEIENAYKTGYQHIIERLKKEAPTTRVFLIKPSPFDDVTRQPGWPGGYNGVMRSYSDYLEGLAKSNGYASVDFNTPVVDMLEKAKVENAELSTKVIGDRVHPGGAGHLVMAQQLLMAWGATPMISNVNIDAQTGRAQAFRASVTGLSAVDKVTWTQTDQGLPFPLDRKDATVTLVLKSGDFDQKLNQQMLTVRNLKPGNHSLTIDGQAVGTFTADQLAAGINLAQYETPMMAQARIVSAAVNQRADMMYQCWRQMEFTLKWADSPKRTAAITAVHDLSDDLIAKTRVAAKPGPHKYELSPAN